MSNADMQSCVSAHGVADYMSPLDLQCIENGDDIGSRKILTIGLRIFGHIRRRIAARRERDASMHARQMSYLGFPCPVVASKFVHEDNRNARACFFDMESYPVFREDHCHLRLRIGVHKG